MLPTFLHARQLAVVIACTLRNINAALRPPPAIPENSLWALNCVMFRLSEAAGNFAVDGVEYRGSSIFKCERGISGENFKYSENNGWTRNRRRRESTFFLVFQFRIMYSILRYRIVFFYGSGTLTEEYFKCISHRNLKLTLVQSFMRHRFYE